MMYPIFGGTINVLLLILLAAACIPSGTAFVVRPSVFVSKNAAKVSSSSSPSSSSSLYMGVSSNNNQDGEQQQEHSSLKNNPSTTISRRDALQQWTGLALSSFLLQTSGVVSPALAEETITTPKNIVITGCNSGIGYEAAVRLAEQGHNLILACRTMAKATDTAQRIEGRASSSIKGKLIPAECDLTSLESIQNFVKTLDLGDQKLDIVCLNAGLSRNTDAKDILRTKEGFELTIGTNHLGHFYLNHLLLPKVQPNGGKIVVTASGVHDPASPGGGVGVPATLGDLKGFEEQGRMFDMVDGGEFNADKAYKDSKLCNVLFTRELQRRLNSSPSTNGIVANCFNPGLIITTGFFRDQNPAFVKVFEFGATKIAKVTETPEWGGAALTYMATSINSQGEYYTAPAGSSKYGEDAFGREFTKTMVSQEAQDDKKAQKLWELSEKLVGISA